MHGSRQLAPVCIGLMLPLVLRWDAGGDCRVDSLRWMELELKARAL